MLFAALREAFPDLKVDIGEQIAEDDRVVTRKTFKGTHGGPFLGLPATGSGVRFEVVDILTIRERRICEHRVVLEQVEFDAAAWGDSGVVSSASGVL
jgi:predicted ester cyclase